MKNNRMSIISTSIVCLIPFIISAVFYKQLPDQVATHFNASGIASGYSSKIVAAFGIPAFLFIINLIMNFILDKNPVEGRGAIVIGRWTIPLIAIFVQALIIAYACGIQFNSNKYILAFIGLLTIIIGNYLPKCQQNNFIGIKTPWALKDNENWRKTHRISGYLWVICGFVLCVNAIFNVVFINIAVIIIMIVIPMIYSYVISKES